MRKSTKAVRNDHQVFLTALAGYSRVAITNDNKFVVSIGSGKDIKLFDLERNELHHCIKDAHKGNNIFIGVFSCY